MDEHDAAPGEDPKQSTADMTAFVQNLLEQMQSRFQAMSDSIITKTSRGTDPGPQVDDMGNRIEELEQTINDLKAEMGVEASPSPPVAPKPKSEGSPSPLNPKVDPKAGVESP